jgi:hypothetical protein
MSAGMRLRGRAAAEIEQAALRLLWRDRLIIGAINLIAGQPGAGKSSLTALMAAEVSRKGTVILSNCEDDPSSVTVPRLAAAGAILERVHVIPPDDAPAFPRELEGLEHVVRETGTKLVVIDPIGAHFSPERLAHDRTSLRRLAAVARRAQCAVVAVHHTTKMGEVGGRHHADRDAECHAWLSEFLAAGEDCARAWGDVRNHGTDLGYGWETLRRAKVSLEVEHVRAGQGAAAYWVWRLPDEHPLRQPAEEPEVSA